jgi:tRNA(Ile)-lysidine synthetase-like protein
MKLSVNPGLYVLAVSGGVDSMVLLDLLTHQSGVQLIVAHFDHGIREDSKTDRELVEAAARRYGLQFVYKNGELGPNASEAIARQARYDFLRQTQTQCRAQAIITAHHQDDLLETAIINLLRGTGRKGLNALQSKDGLLRPLLGYRKSELYKIATDIMRHDPHFMWHEDSTNTTDQYLRNYVRHHIIKELGNAGRQLLLEYAEKAGQTNPLIDGLLLHVMDNSAQPTELRRGWFVMLPYDVSCEVMAAWLRQNGIRQFDRRLIERLVVAAKVVVPGKVLDINTGHWLKVERAILAITPRTRS